jgi:intergrase/recombinase
VGSLGFEPRTSSAPGCEKSAWPTVNYPALRSDFIEFLKTKNFNQHYVKESILSYLNRFVTVIHEPMDVLKVFSGLTPGQQHCLNRGVRNLFNFLEAQGYPKAWLDLLRKNIPKENIGFDIKVPTDAEVITSLRKLSEAGHYESHLAIFNLVLDSGLRLTEATRFLEKFDKAACESHEGFYVAPLGYFRETKLAYFAFFTQETMNLIKSVERIKYDTARGNARKRLGRDITAFKYLRKFAFDTMTDEELNIPESVADFIQGRTPKSIGARHYMQLKRKAIKFYPRYAKYVAVLRQKALN